MQLRRDRRTDPDQVTDGDRRSASSGGAALVVAVAANAALSKATSVAKNPTVSNDGASGTTPTRADVADRCLQSEDAAERGRNPNRAAGVAADRQRHETGGDGCGAAAARSAWHSITVPWIAGRPTRFVLRGDPPTELVRTCEPGDDRARLPNAVTAAASRSAMRPARTSDPYELSAPATSNNSLMPTGRRATIRDSLAPRHRARGQCAVASARSTSRERTDVRRRPDRCDRGLPRCSSSTDVDSVRYHAPMLRAITDVSPREVPSATRCWQYRTSGNRES